MSRTFSPSSRYANVPTRRYVAPDGREIVYVAARILPAPERLAPMTIHRVEQAERVDLLGARYYGDPEQYWRICDANRVDWPPQAGVQADERLVVPMPLEVSDRGES